ncbi:EpsG family protein [Aeromonas media]|uniref:EpsG family protein n=1 Tax=Aeromonas media TaxID=651 RepID=A0ABX6NYF1_AERME|nr:EpsG family protein [Aeromonas media]QJT35325.1 EpsG family protein [Aeromonas media]QJT37146.1 EpsG family protein [Aeromonas media]QJT40916.1 EpsG family protein [Aeromonas media]
MSAYVLLWVGVIVACLAISQYDRVINYMYLKAVFLALVLMIGFRHHVGGDWGNYQAIYDGLTHANWQQAMVATEPGYGLINWLAHQFGFTVHFVNFCCALIFVWGLSRLCLSQPQPWFALLISIPYLVSAVAMGYTRQSAAIGLMMVGLTVLIEHKPWQFFFLIFCAALFHKSAVVALMLIPLALPQLRLGKLFLIGVFVSSVGLFLVMDRLGGMWDLYVTQGMESDGGLVRVLLNSFPAIFFLIFRDKWRQRWPKTYSLVLWLSIAALVLLPLQFIASTAVDRLSLYIIPLQLLVLSQLPLFFTGTVKYLVLFGVICFYSAVYLVWLNFSDWAQCCWIPYDNILLSP